MGQKDGKDELEFLKKDNGGGIDEREGLGKKEVGHGRTSRTDYDEAKNIPYFKGTDFSTGFDEQRQKEENQKEVFVEDDMGDICALV